MAIAASYIAKAIADLDDTSHKFEIYVTSTYITAQAVSGGWTRSANTITWNGADPQIENDSGSSKDIDNLRIDVSGDRMAVIEHTPATLADGDVIKYTSIQIDCVTGS